MSNNFFYFRLSRNSKIPINENYKERIYIKKDKLINKSFNYAIECDKNNLIILDVDNKENKEGTKELDEYFLKYGKFDTLTQKTPNNGYHYIFKRTFKESENILKNYTNLRAKGLDLRINKGYIVSEPSIIDGKEYKFINNVEPIEIPDNLINWLLEFKIFNKNDLDKNENIYYVKANKKELEQILEIVKPINKEWFIMTSAIKNLFNPFNNYTEEELFNIWDNWSKKEPSKYNKEQNIKIYEKTEGIFNLNYFINDKKLKLPTACLLPPKIKPHHTINNKYLSIDILKEHKNKDIIIKSGTGTGKTTLISSYIKEKLETNKNLGFLSFVHLRSMAQEQELKFKNVSLNIQSYLNEEYDIEADNIIICINSLCVYYNYDNEFFKNKIVYIDEITSLLNALSLSPTLDKYYKRVLEIFKRIVKNCHQLIITDAEILENTFYLTEYRNKEYIYIENIYKNWEDIEVNIIKKESLLYETIKNKIDNDEQFFICSDSKKQSDILYAEAMKSQNEKIKNGFKPAFPLKLYTSEEKQIEPENMKNISLIYSPALLCGVDIVPPNFCSVYAYIKQGSINSLSMFQQFTRNRKIKQIYIYFDKNLNKECRFSSLDSVKDIIKNELSMHPKIDNSFNFNSLENKLYFFELYYNELLNSNKKLHLITILKENLFNIKTQKGEIQKLTKEKTNNLKEQDEKFKDNSLNEYLLNNEYNDNNENFRNLPIKILKLNEEEDIIKTLNENPILKTIVNNSTKLKEFLKMNKLFFDEVKINNKYETFKNSLNHHKLIYNEYYKIKILSEYENFFNIERFNFLHLIENKFEYDTTETNKKIIENIINKINISFRCDVIPSNKTEHLNYYVNKLKHFIKFVDIIQTEKIRKQSNKNRYYITVFKPNIEAINNFLICLNRINNNKKYIFKNDKILYEIIENNKKEYDINIDDIEFNE